MRDFLIGFQGETKSLGDSIGPVQKRSLRGHTIETMVNFDRRELLRVKGEHFAIRKFLRVKTSFPLFVRVSGSSHEKFARVRHAHLRGLEFNHSCELWKRTSQPALQMTDLPRFPLRT